MTAPDLVPVDPRARRAWPFLPAITRAGRVHVGPLGELLMIRADGGADQLLQGGTPWGRSIASDPSMGGRPRRYP